MADESSVTPSRFGGKRVSVNFRFRVLGQIRSPNIQHFVGMVGGHSVSDSTIPAPTSKLVREKDMLFSYVQLRIDSGLHKLY